jgi:hypothetical protein
MVWGGDGHNHWHVRRVPIARLTPFGKDGTPPATDRGGRADSKIGFCFYDYSRLLERGTKDPVYSYLGCGIKSDTPSRMQVRRNPSCRRVESSLLANWAESAS